MKLLLVLIAISLLLVQPVLAQEATPAPGPAVYVVELPSGGQGHIEMKISAGEAIIAVGIAALVAVGVFGVLQSWARGAKAK